MDNLVQWIADNWGISIHTQHKVIYSVLVFTALWLVQYFSLKLIYRHSIDVKERYYWRNGIRNSYHGLLILIVGAIWIEGVESLATFLGLVTAGLAIALQVPIVNMAGWLFIILRKPFVVGDRIQIGDFAGDVIDIRLFQLTLNEIGNWVDADQSTGRIIHVPNGLVFKEPQASYTQGFSHIWNEIGVLVTFESDWQKAKVILTEILKTETEQLSAVAEKKLIEASKKFMIFYRTLTPTVYTSVKDSGIMLTMRFLCLPRVRRGTDQRIWEEVLIEFAKHDDIDFAYPTQRLYYNPKEGKGK